MAVIQVPAGLLVGKQTWAQQRNDVEFRSTFGAQVQEASGPLWATDLTPTFEQPTLWQAMALQLRGRTNQIALWNFGKPEPLGTMRGVMTTGATAQGATALTITASGQAGKTLLAGDFLGVGSGLTQQVIMVCANALSNGAGVITVSTEPALRNALAAGAGVTWYRPCALFRRKDSMASWEVAPDVTTVGAMSFLEDWRP